MDIMEINFTIKSELYDIPAVFCQPDTDGLLPAVILCHGTASCKNEVGNLFIHLARSLAEKGIASIRFDFAGCGESTARQQDFTFYREVDDTEKVYVYLCQHEKVDAGRIGILGFSQGARVMAEFLGRHPKEIKTAVSWSGACHNGIGVFVGWFKYYDEACNKGYAQIPIPWRSHLDLILPKKWFDEIRDSSPLDSLSQYEGAMLAVSGTKDILVPYAHAREIAQACRKSRLAEALIIEQADHTFNVLEKDKSIAEKVVGHTASWIAKTI
ncbi:MAG: alpha/beta hydrolase [Firmicutes bacterium]|nr:alpha/beta hydrolase [Bacillota bacterium]